MRTLTNTVIAGEIIGGIELLDLSDLQIFSETLRGFVIRRDLELEGLSQVLTFWAVEHLPGLVSLDLVVPGVPGVEASSVRVGPVVVGPPAREVALGAVHSGRLVVHVIVSLLTVLDVGHRAGLVVPGQYAVHVVRDLAHQLDELLAGLELAGVLNTDEVNKPWM